MYGLVGSNIQSRLEGKRDLAKFGIKTTVFGIRLPVVYKRKVRLCLWPVIAMSLRQSRNFVACFDPTFNSNQFLPIQLTFKNGFVFFTTNHFPNVN